MGGSDLNTTFDADRMRAILARAGRTCTRSAAPCFGHLLEKSQSRARSKAVVWVAVLLAPGRYRKKGLPAVALSRMKSIYRSARSASMPRRAFRSYALTWCGSSPALPSMTHGRSASLGSKPTVDVTHRCVLPLPVACCTVWSQDRFGCLIQHLGPMALAHFRLRRTAGRSMNHDVTDAA